MVARNLFAITLVWKMMSLKTDTEIAGFNFKN
jgi:hypothetical protein